MKYNALLFDADQTLLDFSLAEREGIRQVLAHWDVPFSEELLQLYVDSNKLAWHYYELGQMDKDRLTIFRFEEFFRRAHLDFNADEWNRYYKLKLQNNGFLLPGARDLLDKLHGQAALYIVTNGIKTVQESRLRIAGIVPYFEKIFISEDLGAQKPSRLYFDKVFAQIPFKPDETLIIGDSLSSDITGGINYGIDTCFVNWNGISPDGIQPTYTVRDYNELAVLLQKFGAAL